MNFGQHIERAITNFGLSLENIQQRHRDWNEKSKTLGLISDSDKLRMLKRDLYSEVRLSNANQQKILNLTGAIQILEEIKHAEEERNLEKTRLNLSMPAQINLTLNSALMFILLVVIGSYTASWTCGNSHSMFCTHARSVVHPINQFFSEPNVNR